MSDPWADHEECAARIRELEAEVDMLLRMKADEAQHRLVLEREAHDLREALGRAERRIDAEAAL